MTPNPKAVTPDDTMEVVRHYFEKHGFHHVPVIEHGILVGMISYTDFLGLISTVFENGSDARKNEKTLHETRVRDVMATPVLCLLEDDSLEVALRIFKTNHFHALPVVDRKQHLVGILTTYDLMRVLENVFALEQR